MDTPHTPRPRRPLRRLGAPLGAAVLIAAWLGGAVGPSVANGPTTTGPTGNTHPHGTDIGELLRRGGCLLCHRPSRAWIGPSFLEIAEEHRGASATERTALMQRLRTGSVGNRTPIPMGPCDVNRLSDDDLRRIVDHILDQGPLPSQNSLR